MKLVEGREALQKQKGNSIIHMPAFEELSQSPSKMLTRVWSTIAVLYMHNELWHHAAMSNHVSRTKEARESLDIVVLQSHAIEKNKLEK